MINAETARKNTLNYRYPNLTSIIEKSIKNGKWETEEITDFWTFQDINYLKQLGYNIHIISGTLSSGTNKITIIINWEIPDIFIK